MQVARASAVPVHVLSTEKTRTRHVRPAAKSRKRPWCGESPSLAQPRTRRSAASIWAGLAIQTWACCNARPDPRLWSLTTGLPERRGKRGYASHHQAHTWHCDKTTVAPPKYPQIGTKRRESETPSLTVKPVKRCARFVPTSRGPALPAQKKALQKNPKPTPGFEPGTPSYE
jgi:hypothetical protein